nr:EamA family transporter [Gemmatimonadota bacterium]
ALAWIALDIAAGGPEIPATPRSWLLVATIALVSTALSILAMLASTRRIGAATTSVILTLEVAVTALLAALLLGEALAPRQYVGGSLILAGVVLVRLAGRTSREGAAS